MELQHRKFQGCSELSYPLMKHLIMQLNMFIILQIYFSGPTALFIIFYKYLLQLLERFYINYNNNHHHNYYIMNVYQLYKLK